MPAYPKHPSVRQRRNATTTATQLQVVNPETVEVPDLPTRVVRVKDKETGEEVVTPAQWHPQAEQTWIEVWTSPMVAEFLTADYGGIRILLALEHDFWSRLEAGRSVTELAAEISRLRKNFGLAPMGRRSLQWTIAQTEETMERNQRRRTAPRQLADVEGTATELPGGDDADDFLGALE